MAALLRKMARLLLLQRLDRLPDEAAPEGLAPRLPVAHDHAAAQPVATTGTVDLEEVPHLLQRSWTDSVYHMGTIIMRIRTRITYLFVSRNIYIYV